MRADRRILIAAVLCVIPAGSVIAEPSAQPFPPLGREPLLEDVLPPSLPAAHVVKAARIGFAPGQPTGLHRHPVPVIGVVTAGAWTVLKTLAR